MMKRQFNKEAYDECDGKAREAISDFLKNLGFTVEKNEEDYKVDIKALRPEGHELEVRTVWEGDKFPFDSIHIPYRKKKVIDSNRYVFFWVLRKDYKKAYVVDGRDVQDTEVKNVKANGIWEKFYDVPLKEWSLITLKD